MPVVTATPTPWADAGMALKIERTLSRVTLTQVAAEMGVSIGHLSHIEAGRRYASPETADAIRGAIRMVAARRAA